jgi:hypothetical protein
MTSEFLTVALFVLVENLQCLLLYLLGVFIVCLLTKFYVAMVGTANSGRTPEEVGVLCSCFVIYESLPNPLLLKVAVLPGSAHI